MPRSVLQLKEKGLSNSLNTSEALCFSIRFSQLYCMDEKIWNRWQSRVNLEQQNRGYSGKVITVPIKKK